MSNVECRMSNAECRMPNAECRMPEPAPFIRTLCSILQPPGPSRRLKRTASMIACLFAAAVSGLLASQAPQAAASHPLVRVFLDCPRCDEDYLRREVTFIDYVR